uniref:uncharacterized protein LOC122591396 n=1 Tax=Erigeron canadensis TaxID=72917 RepID=UPI001CB90D19|nr:uncharacterized protein LOC122591396 [Erigeron canadensis]
MEEYEVWKNVIWFRQFIPRHAFILWLVVQEKLLTQDKMVIWKQNAEYKCVFCNEFADSHEHLFYKCRYIGEIWKLLSQRFYQMQQVDSLHEVIRILARDKENNNLGVVVNRIMVVAAVYYIWQERNARIFRSQERNKEGLSQIIRDSVRTQLLSIKVRKTRNVEQIADMRGAEMEG